MVYFLLENLIYHSDLSQIKIIVPFVQINTVSLFYSSWNKLELVLINWRDCSWQKYLQGTSCKARFWFHVRLSMSAPFHQGNQCHWTTRGGVYVHYRQLVDSDSIKDRQASWWLCVLLGSLSLPHWRHCLWTQLIHHYQTPHRSRGSSTTFTVSWGYQQLRIRKSLKCWNSRAEK